MNERSYYVYIMASLSGTLHTGVCNDIFTRAVNAIKAEKTIKVETRKESGTD
jgi:predicted GIY-YIG superfamily endonuclease